jgi:hypothetical protein
MIAIKEKKTLGNTEGQENSAGKELQKACIFPPIHLTGHDIDGKKVTAFDFVASINNQTVAEPFMEQAQADAKSTIYHGYLIDSPLAKAWKNLEYCLLNTIKKYKFPITLEDRVRDQKIKIFPQGGKSLDVEKSNPIRYYPTIQIYDNKTKDCVDYEYFQVSAEERAWIALNLLEKLA